MKDYLPESMRRCPPGYARGELERAMEEGTILTARAVRCDETHDLIIDLGCAEGRIPLLEAAEGVADGRKPVKTALNYTKFSFCIIASIKRAALPAWSCGVCN